MGASPMLLSVNSTAFAGLTLKRRRVHRQMHLAPHASLGPAMLASMPFALAPDLDPGAVDQKMQQAARAAVGQLHGQRLLTAAQGRDVRHRPVQACKLEQTRHEARRLAQRQAEPSQGSARSGLDLSTGPIPRRPSPFTVRQAWIAASL